MPLTAFQNVELAGKVQQAGEANRKEKQNRKENRNRKEKQNIPPLIRELRPVIRVRESSTVAHINPSS